MAAITLDAIKELIDGLDPKARAELNDIVPKGEQWTPIPGSPQERALNSQADELFYGGGAGCGKSSLLVGAAITRHHHSILFRRESPQLIGLIDEAANILGTYDGFSDKPPMWELSDGHRIEFGYCQYDKDKEKYQGRAHDLKGFDEITGFTEAQFRFITGWNRPAPGVPETQRCRVICTGNPPSSPEGRWVIKYWGPWLDKKYPNPAKDGELRWFTTIDGHDTEVDGPGPHDIPGSPKPVRALSRTFIGSTLEDNPYLAGTNYEAKLMAMPEPMRTMLRYGRFDLSLQDDETQVIPSEWVRAAQDRWTPDGHMGWHMTAMGVDVAQGGPDQTVLAPRYGPWFAPLIVKPGRETPDPPTTAGLIHMHRRDAAAIVVDCAGGWGGGVAAYLKDNGIPVARFLGSNASTRRTQDGSLKFRNKRAESIWRLREALDPSQDGGSPLAFPPDPELFADLCAYRWHLSPQGIQIDDKDEMRKAIGRSPDRGDAVSMAWSEGELQAERKLSSGFGMHRADEIIGMRRRPQVVRGYEHLKR